MLTPLFRFQSNESYRDIGCVLIKGKRLWLCWKHYARQRTTRYYCGQAFTVATKAD